MAVSQQLLEYQKVDAELLKIEQSVAGSEERKKFMQAKKFMEAAREKLDAQDKRAAELRRLRDDLVQRTEEITRQIAEYADLDEMIGEEGGDVSFYKKNAQQLLERLRMVKGELAKLTADVTAAAEEYERLKKQTIAMQKQGEEYSKKFKELKGKHAAEAEALQQKLTEIAKAIPKEVMARYQQKRKEKIFPIIVPLNGDRCVCGMDFPLAQQGRLDGGNVIECEHCRRFVYKP